MTSTPTGNGADTPDSRSRGARVGSESTGRVGRMRMGTEKPPKHGGGTWRSLVISMIVILAGVLLWQALTPNVSRVEQRAVDVSASARGVHRETAWPILVADLGPEWKPTSVRFDDKAGVKTWEVGYTRTDDETVFVGVAQTASSASTNEDWVREFTRSGGADGTVTVGGSEWSAFTAMEKNPRHSLVAPPGATPVAVVVSGLGDKANLATVAAALKPYTP